MKTLVTNSIILLSALVLFACSGEKKDWQKSLEVNTVQDFEGFQQKYPGSIFFDSASIKIEKLVFDDACAKNTVDDYNLFLERFPSGNYTELAEDKIIELELSEALALKDLLKVIGIIDAHPESKLISALMLTATDSVKMKPRYTIYEHFITKILSGESKNIVQFIIPPNRVIEEEVAEVLEGMKIVRGDIIAVLSVAARGGIQEISSETGCTLQKVLSKDELLYGVSDTLIIARGVYIKVSENLYLYSVDDETQLSRSAKPNIFLLSSGKVFLIKLA